MYRKEVIYIDLQGLNWYYKPFLSLIVDRGTSNLVKFSFMATLFVNIKRITVKMLMFDSVSKKYLTALIQDISKLNQLQNKHKLKDIKMELIRVNVNKSKWKEFETTMNSLNCILQLTGKGNEGYKELLIKLNANKM